MAGSRGRKGPLAGNNLLWFALLAAGGYLAWTKVIQPGMGGNGRSNNSLPGGASDFDYGTRYHADGSSVPVKLRNKFKGGPSGIDPYSGIANDGSPTIYQDEWGAIA